jgi:hypothetical protein
MIRGIFQHKEDGVTDGWRKLHSEDLYWVEHVTRMEIYRMHKILC